MPGAHHYTFLETTDGPMSVHRIDARMELLIALPDRCDTRLTVPFPGEEAPELRETPHHVTERRRLLRRGGFVRHGVEGMPFARLEHDIARLPRVRPPQHRDGVDPPCDDERDRHGVEEPLGGRQTSLSL
jgi:hypothetical protein